MPSQTYAQENSDEHSNKESENGNGGEGNGNPGENGNGDGGGQGNSGNGNSPATEPPAGNSPLPLTEEEFALQADRSSEAVPLSNIRADVRQHSSGAIIDANLIRVAQHLLYEIKVLEARGEVKRLYYYAKSGGACPLREVNASNCQVARAPG